MFTTIIMRIYEIRITRLYNIENLIKDFGKYTSDVY